MLETSLSPFAAVILAAGQGTRMKSSLPKVLHQIANQPMIQHVIAACVEAEASKIIVVTAPDAEIVRQAIAPHDSVVQMVARGTGDALKTALPVLQNFKGDVIALFGDTPMLTANSINAMRTKRAETGAAIIVAGFNPVDAAAYGRLVLDTAGDLTAIVEAADATPEQRKIGFCNGGLMLFDSRHLAELLAGLTANNAKGEYYLTDCVGLARKAGLRCGVVTLPEEEVLGVNSRVELAMAERLMQQRLRKRVMLDGATLTDPGTVYLSSDTRIGRDVTIGPNVVIGAGVTIADNVEIRSFCHLEKVGIESGAIIGPFARLRPGSEIGPDAHIGNFVEIKNAKIGAGTKVNHLSYVGDASVGPKTNIGAGTITANYDGFHKHRTDIGAGVSIGSDVVLVAPVTIGNGANIAAGSVINQDVPADALAVARERQVNKPDWAKRFREQKERK